MLLQASIEIANAERWALEIGEEPAPKNLQTSLRHAAYEVTVVDIFHRVARTYFQRHSYRAVWERPFHTGKKGRPESIDISLFSTAAASETRLELGLYTKAKLAADAEKLARLSTESLAEFGIVNNYLLLWEIPSKKLTANTAADAVKRFRSHAASVSTSLSNGLQVELLVASSVDLFVAEQGTARHATAGLFVLV